MQQDGGSLTYGKVELELHYIGVFTCWTQCEQSGLLNSVVLYYI